MSEQEQDEPQWFRVTAPDELGEGRVKSVSCGRARVVGPAGPSLIEIATDPELV